MISMNVSNKYYSSSENHFVNLLLTCKMITYLAIWTFSAIHKYPMPFSQQIYSTCSSKIWRRWSICSQKEDLWFFNLFIKLWIYNLICLPYYSIYLCKLWIYFSFKINMIICHPINLWISLIRHKVICSFLWHFRI